MNKLLEMLSAMHPLSNEFQQALSKRIVTLSLPKNHILLNAAHVSDDAFFLETGFAMSFQYVKGRKHVEEFFPEGRIVVSPLSFFQRLPSKETIQLLEQSDVLHISFESVMWLLDNFPEANVIYRITMNSYYEQSRDRIRDFQRLTAMQRYGKMNEIYPNVKHLVPLEQIATYLGIAPQHLSRLRRESDDA